MNSLLMPDIVQEQVVLLLVNVVNALHCHLPPSEYYVYISQELVTLPG